MARPDQIGTVYDLVIGHYNEVANLLETYGFILEENSYRMAPAEQMAPKVAQGAENLGNLVGALRVAYWNDWRGGIDDRQTNRPNRYYRGENVWALRQGELSLTPQADSVKYVSAPVRPVRAPLVRYQDGLWGLIANQPPADANADTALLHYREDSNAWKGIMYFASPVHALMPFNGALYAFGESGTYRATGDSRIYMNQWETVDNKPYRTPVIYDDRLYVAGNSPGIPNLAATSFSISGSVNKLYALTPNTTSFAEVASLGTPDSEIRSLAVLAGTLYAGKDDGLWAFRQNKAWKVTDIVPVGFSSSKIDPASPHFEGMAEHQGWLYYKIYSQPFRFNGASVEVLYGDHVSSILGFAGQGELLYMPAMDGSQGGVWVSRDQGQHNFAYGMPLPYAMGALGKETHFMFRDTTALQPAFKKIVWEDVENLVPTKYNKVGKVHLPWTDADLPTWPKEYAEMMVRATFDSGSGAGGLDMYYQPREATIVAVDSSVVPDYGEVEASVSRGIVRYPWRKRATGQIWLRSDSAQQTTPKLNMAGLAFTLKATPANQHTFRVRCEDDLELRDSSYDTLDSIQLYSALVQLAGVRKVILWGPLGAAARVTYGDGTNDYSALLRRDDGDTADFAGQDIVIGSAFPFDAIHIRFTDSAISVSGTAVSVNVINENNFGTGLWDQASARVCKRLYDNGSPGGAQARTIIFEKDPLWRPLLPSSDAPLDVTKTVGARLYWATVASMGSPQTISSIRLGRFAQMRVAGVTAGDMEETRPSVACTAVEL